MLTHNANSAVAKACVAGSRNAAMPCDELSHARPQLSPAKALELVDGLRE